MNETTPQKALQDVIALGAQCAPVIDNGDGREIWHSVGPGGRVGAFAFAGYVEYFCALDALVRQHGQHFAGLEASNEYAKKLLAEALDADRDPDEPLRTLAVRASNALYWRTQRLFESEARAETAEAELARCRAEVSEIAAAIRGPHYMDPPDGGDVTVAEQVRRMADDAARYRWLRSHLPPGTFGDFDVFDPASWDAAIDAAMRQDQGANHAEKGEGNG